MRKYASVDRMNFTVLKILLFSIVLSSSGMYAEDCSDLTGKEIAKKRARQAAGCALGLFLAGLVPASGYALYEKYSDFGVEPDDTAVVPDTELANRRVVLCAQQSASQGVQAVGTATFNPNNKWFDAREVGQGCPHFSELSSLVSCESTTESALNGSRCTAPTGIPLLELMVGDSSGESGECIVRCFKGTRHQQPGPEKHGWVCRSQSLCNRYIALATECDVDPDVFDGLKCASE